MRIQTLIQTRDLLETRLAKALSRHERTAKLLENVKMLISSDIEFASGNGSQNISMRLAYDLQTHASLAIAEMEAHRGHKLDGLCLCWIPATLLRREGQSIHG
jgi:hypothetical protein